MAYESSIEEQFWQKEMRVKKKIRLLKSINWLLIFFLAIFFLSYLLAGMVFMPSFDDLVRILFFILGLEVVCLQILLYFIMRVKVRKTAKEIFQ